MRRVPVLTAAEAAALVAPGARVSISSSSALGCPDALLAALGERFRSTGDPRGITAILPIAAGDMYGVQGVDHLAVPGLLRRVVAGSYPSGPSGLPPPAIWQLIEAGEVEAYNLPSGVLYQAHRTGAVGAPGVLTEVGLDTFVDPRHQGGRMNAHTREDLVELVTLGGREWLFVPSVTPDVTLLRATTADEAGNLTFEDEGSPLGALDQAYAAHNSGGVVIAQVKRLAEAGSLSAQQVRVPGIVVDAVVLAPDALQTTQTPYDPALSGALRRPLARIPAAEFSVAKVIARRAAQELRAGDTVNLGFGISALLPGILLEEGRHGEVTWVIEQGPVGGLPVTGFAFGCALNAEALLASSDQFTLLQGGGFDQAMLSFLEVDPAGSVNVHHLPGRRHVSAGIGGFADITARAPRIVFSGAFTAGGALVRVADGRLHIDSEGRARKFVPRLAEASFSGRRAQASGQQVRYVTERCVLTLGPDGPVVTEVAPGVDVQRDVVGQAAFPLLVARDLREMDPRLFRPEPMGLELPERSPRVAPAGDPLGTGGRP